MLEQLWGLVAPPPPRIDQLLEYGPKKKDSRRRLEPEEEPAPGGLCRSSSCGSLGTRQRNIATLDPRKLSAGVVGAASDSSSSKACNTAVTRGAKNHDTAAIVAKVLRALATKRVDASWDKLREEFEVQKLIWQSLGQIKGKSAQSKLLALQTDIESLLSGRADNPQSVVQKLKHAHGEESDLFSNSMREAMQNVIRHESAYTSRIHLAEELESPPKALVDDAAVEELEAIIVACRLSDAKLELRIRRALLLPVIIELGAPVASESTQSACAVLEGAIVAYSRRQPLSELLQQTPFVPASRPTFFRPPLLSETSPKSAFSVGSSLTASSHIAPLRNAPPMALQMSNTDAEGGKEKAIIIRRSSTNSSLGISYGSSAPAVIKRPSRLKPRRWIV